jgi:methylthioribose-1-phosphate isomerase
MRIYNRPQAIILPMARFTHYPFKDVSMRAAPFLLSFSLVASLLVGCAPHPTTPASMSGPYASTPQSVVSDRAEMDFQNDGVYFKTETSKPTAAQFSESLNACLQSQVDNYKLNGQGVQVMRSLGFSEAKIINDGNRLCMESKGWGLYKVINNQIQRVSSSQVSYATMSEMELKSARRLVVSQRKWYLTYEPQVLAVGDLLK